MDVIRDKKVKLIEWLCGEEIVLQYVSSRKLITMNEYTTVKSIPDPVKKVTELLDLILGKGNKTCIAFLELLKEDDVNESRPELREWIKTVNTSEIKAASQSSAESSAGNSISITATDGSIVNCPIIFGSQMSSSDMNLNAGPQKKD